MLVLLAAMIPIGRAFETTGGAELISNGLTSLTEGVSPLVVLATLIVVTSLLSDVISNAAAAILSAPIAVTVAAELGASSDPFLMGVAVGASAAFLTPIGHQSNTLVLGPGGYRFGDYWRLGLPLEDRGRGGCRSAYLGGLAAWRVKATCGLYCRASSNAC